MNRAAMRVAWIVALASILTGCGGHAGNGGNNGTGIAAAEDVELSMLWWGSQDRHDVTLKAIRKFREKYPHILVTGEFSGWDGYWDKLSVQTSANNTPDVIQMSYAYLNEYVGRDALLALDNLNVDFSRMDPSFAYEATINGSVYAVPLSIQSHTLVYNPRLLEESGIALGEQRMTLARFADVAKQVTDKLGGRGVFGVADSTANVSFFLYYMRQLGYNAYENDRIGYPEEALVEYLTFWNDLRIAGATSSGEVTASYFETGVEHQPIVNGQTAFQFTPLPIYGSFAEFSQAPLDVLSIPYKENAKEGLYIESGFYWSIGADTKHPQEAAQLIDYLVNDTEAGAILGVNRGIPASLAVREAIVEGLDDVQKRQFDYLKQTETLATPLHNYVSPKGASEVDSLFLTLVQEMQFDRKSPEQVAAVFIPKANAILAEANR